MVSLRFIVWLLLSALTFFIALVAFVLTQQIPALDNGWLNGLLLLGIWIAIVSTLRRTLLDDWSSRGSGSLVSHHTAATTLEYRRR